jgi:hypothetical protein
MSLTYQDEYITAKIDESIDSKAAAILKHGQNA